MRLSSDSAFCQAAEEDLVVLVSLQSLQPRHNSFDRRHQIRKLGIYRLQTLQKIDHPFGFMQQDFRVQGLERFYQ